MTRDWREDTVNYMWRNLTRHAPDTFGDPAPHCMTRPSIDINTWTPHRLTPVTKLLP